MCIVLLPPGGYPIAVIYIISYHTNLKGSLSTLLRHIGRRRIAPLILKLGARGKLLNDAWSLYPRGKKLLFPLNGGLCGPQNRPGRFEAEINL
jgi:hypothetical protein